MSNKAMISPGGRRCLVPEHQVDGLKGQGFKLAEEAKETKSSKSPTTKSAKE